MAGSNFLTTRLRTVMEDKLGRRVPSLDMDLFESGILDSLALVDLIMHVEQEFGIVIPLEKIDLESFRSVSDIAEFIGRYTAAEPMQSGSAVRRQGRRR